MHHMAQSLKAPFPWFGGKSRAAPLIWTALGDVENYVEPFFGSGAVLLGRPHAPHTETINDKDGFVCNFYRAVQHDPEGVAHYADYPSSECDLHARHSYLVRKRAVLTARLEGNPSYYNSRIAGWWCWGACCWISGGWCSGEGPWHTVGGRLVKGVSDGMGARRQRPHLGNDGLGVQRRKMTRVGLTSWMCDLCERLRYVRITCGDWTRVLGPGITWKRWLTGIVLDPPYSHSRRTNTVKVYAVEADIAPAIEAWCLAHGDNPRLRIVLCGYRGEYRLPGWRQVRWKAPRGGLSTKSYLNKYRERLWLSPACLDMPD